MAARDGELLEGLPARIRIRGNVERWLRERPEVPESVQEFLATGLTAAREALGPELVDRLYALPEQAELDGILVCHGSPLSDIESFAPEARRAKSASSPASRIGRSSSATVTSSSGDQGRTGRCS